MEGAPARHGSIAPDPKIISGHRGNRGLASGFGNREPVSVSRPKFPTEMSWGREGALEVRL